MILLLSRFQCLSYGRSNGKIYRLGLEPMNVLAKLTFLSGLSKEHLLSLPILLYNLPFRRSKVRQTNFDDYIYTRLLMQATALLIWSWATGRMAGVLFPAGARENILNSAASRPTLGPIQPPIQWIPGSVY
jgi:hypothetical protein